MVKAELKYNPYLKQTEILFNGNKPRINSQTEKYQDMKLMDWINVLPSVFYDEMNGYGFELEFSGTALEFNALKNAFNNAGATEDQVKLFHKNELDNRQVKCNHIGALLEWLEKNPNRNFDINAFKKENEELLEGAYQFVIINGKRLNIEDFEEDDVSIELIDSVTELQNTVLDNTPVLIYVDEPFMNDLYHTISWVLERTDIKNNQVFFMIDSSLNRLRVERIIKDLGIKNLNGVTALGEGKIRNYFAAYPMTDYIYESIALFVQIYENIDQHLEAENKKSKKINKDIHKSIDVLEAELKALKEAKGRFDNKDNLELISSLESAKYKLCSAIYNWKNRKTKITRRDEAEKVALEFEHDLFAYYNDFIGETINIVQAEKHVITESFDNYYRETTSPPFDYTKIELDELRLEALPGVVATLLNLKEEYYVEGKDDLVGFLFKNTDGIKTPVLETTYYYQEWREYVLNVVEPAADKLIHDQFEILNAYYNNLAEAYKTELVKCINEKTQQKEAISAQLSEDEKQLQNDNDWLVEFRDHLDVIVKG